MERHELQLKRRRKDVEMAEAEPSPPAEPASSAVAGAAALRDAAACGVPQERPHPDAINAFDMHEGAGLMAYTHIGSADYSISVGQMPSAVTV